MDDPKDKELNSKMADFMESQLDSLPATTNGKVVAK